MGWQPTKLCIQADDCWIDQLLLEKTRPVFREIAGEIGEARVVRDYYGRIPA
jgi:hypothetical protein